MSRFYLVLCVGIYLSFVDTAVMNAQGASYDENALRLEGHRGDVRIVRGVHGTVLGKIGTFHSIDVAKLVSPSEKATAEARIFASDYGPGTWLAALGIATLGVAIGVSQIHDVNRGITTGLTLAGTGLIVYGGGRMENAYNALSRSIWWYNRDLKR
jgi:hypothetical protein